MNYIGSKYTLLPFISEAIDNVAGKDLSDKVFCDLFAGTGIVGRYYKPKVKKVIANDWEYYSYVLNRNYIGNHIALRDQQPYIDRLNSLKGIETGFIYNNYCEGSGSCRQYFSDENGKKIDAARKQIDNWKSSISEDLYFFLLCSLIESADKVANTASVYGAFLKKLKATALKPLTIQPANFSINSNEHQVLQMDANQAIRNISGDILYLDPPYNARQYGANYHLLNTIAENKPFKPRGKTGLRNYTRSEYCSKRSVPASFEDLIRNADFKYILLSYNNEGLIPLESIKSNMGKYGRYDVISQSYQRFRADKEENRHHSGTRTVEYIHILEK